MISSSSGIAPVHRRLMAGACAIFHARRTPCFIRRRSSGSLRNPSEIAGEILGLALLRNTRPREPGRWRATTSAAPCLGGSCSARLGDIHALLPFAALLFLALRLGGLGPRVRSAPARAEQGTTAARHVEFGASLSMACVTESGGSVVQRVRFAPFGEPVLFEADGSTPLSKVEHGAEPIFGGMPYLAGLGLYQADARLYAHRHGVFVARDPLLYRDSASPYVYARHNPVDLIDPKGDIAFVAVLAIVGVGAVVGAD